MTFDPLWKQAAYAQLEAERATIEAEIGANAGEKFSWEPRPGKKSAAIQLEAPINPKEDTNREAIKVWMYEKSVAFYKAFHNRVKKLKAPIGIDEMESEEN
jgi:hypothetical protein